MIRSIALKRSELLRQRSHFFLFSVGDHCRELQDERDD